MKKLVMVFFSVSLIFLIANGAEPNNKIYSYQKVFDAQFACSPELFSKLNLESMAKTDLATRSWSVITNLKIQDYSVGEKSNERKFRVTFIGVGHIACGEEVGGLDSFCGESMVEIPILKESTKNKNLINLDFDEAREAVREEWGSYTGVALSTDMPVPEGTEGFSCLVTLEDIVKSPKAINLDQLCKGRSEHDREKTQKEIEKAVHIWKARKCVDSDF